MFKEGGGGAVNSCMALPVQLQLSLYNYPDCLKPFLIINGLSCPHCVQASLSLNCLKLTVSGFPYKLISLSSVDIGIKNSRGQAVCFGQVWQPAVNRNGRLALFYFKRAKRRKYSLQRSVLSDAAIQIFKKCAKPSGLLYLTGSPSMVFSGQGGRYAKGQCSRRSFLMQMKGLIDMKLQGSHIRISAGKPGRTFAEQKK